MDIKESTIYQGSSFKERHPWELARIAVIRKLMLKILNQSDSCRRNVLDVGSGDAFMIQNLLKIFPDLEFTGLDTAYTPSQIESFAGHPEMSGCKFYNSMEFLESQESRPDIVLFLDVLEHIEDDLQLVTQIVSVLNSSGFVLITVPAFQGLFCSHDVWLGHHRRYSKRQLEKIVRTAGLEIIDAGYFFSSLLLPRLFRKLAELFKSNKQVRNVGIGEWSYGPFAANIIKTGLTINACIDIGCAENHLPNIGLSVYAICRKSA